MAVFHPLLVSESDFYFMHLNTTYHMTLRSITQMLKYDHHTMGAMPVAMGGAQRPTCLKLQVSHRAQVLQPTAHNTCATRANANPTARVLHSRKSEVHVNSRPAWRSINPLLMVRIQCNFKDRFAFQTAGIKVPDASAYAPGPHSNYNVAPQECCRPPLSCCKDFGKSRAVAPHIL